VITPGETDVAVLTPILDTIKAALNDTKHVKVRVAAIDCIGKLIKSSNKTAGALMSSATSRKQVEDLLRNASSDSQPSVLETAAKSQRIWNDYVLSSSY
jgi:hypothetical protein